jgi:CheY-like chemotaxis protein
MTELSKLTSARVQIVEDEAIVAHDLRQNLESMGYSVTGIASGEQQAVELAEAQRPDLVLMDINLGRGGTAHGRRE